MLQLGRLPRHSAPGPLPASPAIEQGGRAAGARDVRQSLPHDATSSARPLYADRSRLALGAADFPGRPQSSTGLPAQLQASVERLSGQSLDDVKVHYNSEKPAQLQALAYTQGSSIFVGRGQERHLPHEAWHVVQQKQGRVQTTAQLKGVGLNDQPALEAEADRMGALAARGAGRWESPRIAWNPPEIGQAGPGAAGVSRGAPPIQRKVTSFYVTYDTYAPPASDLVDSVDYNYFTETQKQAQTKIRAKLWDPKASATEVPEHIEASIAPHGFGDKTPARKSHKSSVIGKIGTDEFFLKAGSHEVFEGGHLIPHEVWSDSDPDVDLADDYVNLVPMSRNMNVGSSGTWKEIENYITGKVKSGKSIDVEIEIDHEPYDISYDRLAKLFGLTVDAGNGYDGADTVELYGWFPKELKPSDVTGKPKDLGTVTENQLHDTFSPITTGAELVEALMETPLWHRMDQKLRDDVSGL